MDAAHDEHMARSGTDKVWAAASDKHRNFDKSTVPSAGTSVDRKREVPNVCICKVKNKRARCEGSAFNSCASITGAPGVVVVADDESFDSI